MIVVDSNFKRVNKDMSYYNNIYNNIIDFLNKIITNDKIKKDMMDNNEYIIIEETLGDYYSIQMNDGNVKTNPFPSSSAAFKTNMVIRSNNDVLGIRPGIALRPNFTDNQLIHELLHAISSTQINRFNNEGFTYTKVGTRVDFFDRNLNSYNNANNLSSNGLNEGITEYLTSIITNKYNGQYPSGVVIAKLLMSSNNNLLNAYFSKDLDDLELFYSDLEERQSLVTRTDLINFNFENTDVEDISRIIAGAINYNKSYNKEVDYNWIVSYLDNYDMLDVGSWNDLIKKYVDNKDISMI